MKLIAFVRILLWPVDRGLALGAYVAVVVYRLWISPYKGFLCAHGALTREPSCSEVAARAFRQTTFSRAIPIIRAQFSQCRRTYAAYSNDLINFADAHLAKFGSLATAGVIGCCPGCPVDPDPGPLQLHKDSPPAVAKLDHPSSPRVPADDLLPVRQGRESSEGIDKD